MLWYIARVIDLRMYKPMWQWTLRNYKKKGPSLQNVKGKLSVVDWNQERKDGMKHDEMQNFVIIHTCQEYWNFQVIEHESETPLLQLDL